MTLPVLAEVVRSSFVEGHHCGSVAGLDAAGTLALAVGAATAAVFPRSSNKPLQAVGLLQAGLAEVLGRADDQAEVDVLLAVVSASHSGEELHVRAVRRLLTLAGLDESALRCPPSLPINEPAGHALLAAGGAADRLHMNCSGKHAGMLAACVAAGWPVDGYLAADHPVQRALRGAVVELAGADVPATGVDGCGAPLFALPLDALARAFARLVAAEPGSPQRRVADAMRARPDVVGGTDRDVTTLMRGVPGLLAKDGAEGVYSAALPDGPAVAVKIDDGAGRARAPVLVAAFRALGVDAPAFHALAETPVLGGGGPVGCVRAVPFS